MMIYLNEDKKMVKHLVFFRIKKEIANKEKTIGEFILALKQLKERIPSIVYLEIGRNINPHPLAHDISLITEFEDSDGLKAYAEHPAYVQITEHLLQVTTDRSFIDYEVKR